MHVEREADARVRGMALAEDLQRCRRMVSGMRSLVMASSLRQQLLGEVQIALVARDKRLAQQRQNAKDAEPSTPRRRYVHQFRTARIRVIQRQWRKHRLQRIIADKMKLERKWRAKRGNKRMEKSAKDIQRVYRGFYARKRLRNTEEPAILALIVHAQKQSRLDQLRSDRKQFHSRLQSRLQELSQEKRNLDRIRLEKAETEQKISKTAATAAATTRKASTLFIDTKLLDGTVVRMEAHQLLVHQTSEVERLEGVIADLMDAVDHLQGVDPVVQRAASLIQCQFRNYIAYKRKQARLHRQLTARLRLRVSSERCYDRMNADFLQRQREHWNICAKIIAGLFHIFVAKRLLHHYRQKRAVALIERIYTQKRDRVDAQAHVAWRKTKMRAQLFALRRLRRRINHCWRDWCGFTAYKKTRRAQVTRALEDGQVRWIESKAVHLQRFCRRTMVLRHSLAEQIVPVLHPSLYQTVKTLPSLPVEPREQFLRFYQQIVQEMHSWRVPTDHLYALARRYSLPLDVLPIDDIWMWLLTQQQDNTDFSSSTAWFLDLRTPFTTRALRFLASMSRYYDLHDRISFQLDQIWLHFEARLSIRHYLQQLFAHDAVVYTSTTVFSSQQRDKAIQWLQQLIDEDSATAPGNFVNASEGKDPPFTTFHCVWTDLCEQCLAMHCDRSARVCESCGHRRVERSTAAQAGHAAVAQPVALRLESSNPAHWIKETERCDFVVINAFYHALAPRGHAHREMYPPETLWKIALAKAFESVTILYEKHEVRTLDEMLQYGDHHKASGLRAWESFLPVQVIDKLELFLRIMREELVATQQEGMQWH